MIDERLDEIIEGIEQIKITAEQKQDELVSGTNIKTINNNSILGEGNINIESGSTITVDNELSPTSENPVQNKVVYSKFSDVHDSVREALAAKQDELVSGTNIKTINYTDITGPGNLNVQEVLVSGENINTINHQDILGEGNLDVQEVLVSGENIKNINGQSILDSGNINLQEPLVSGQNIKTINNNSILGSGNIEIQTANAVDSTMSDSSENAVQNKVIKTYVDGQISSVDSDINSIEAVIPTQAAANNQLTDKDFVNSSIATSTAEFRGTHEGATWQQALGGVAGNKNDYAFYKYTDSDGNTKFDRYKYKPLADALVPEGYTQLDSINKTYSNQAAYIDTGCTISPTDKIHCEITMREANYTYGCNFLGVYNNVSNNVGDNGFSFSKTGRYSYAYLSKVNGVEKNSGTVELQNNTQRLIVKIENGKLYVNDIEYTSYPIPDISFDYTLYVFSANGAGSPLYGSFQAIYNIHRLTVYDENNNTKLDLVPCKNSSNVNGMIDIASVNKTFYSSLGGAAFESTALSTVPWEFEYSLNNSGFTAAQWSTINSGLAQHVTNTGYSSSGTQVLKNINGVIQWVTES